ncbi:MAG: NAD(P)-dependent glycerol-3-phosphate dehydrogenase [Chloroflexi bacterium]|nr:NAD(P)-dependent glycerol-3-phosphate dehydrogenase [Chloroflexota bacterium]
MPKVGVVGTTSWGTTLGIIVARIGTDVSIWARTELEAATLESARQNERFLPGVNFPQSLSVSASPTEALSDADIVLVVVPSRTFRANIRQVCGALRSDAILVSATKGLETRTGKRMSEVFADELPAGMHSGICALSGPNLSREIIAGKPASTVVASANFDAARTAQSAINSNLFRVYTNEDITGVEFGGALKNIIALAAGVCDGMNYGDNAKATVITRGLAEVGRLAESAGANPLTLSGLAGMGDLIATCSSTLSRNHYFGMRLASGDSPEEISASMDNVAEGVDTIQGAITVARRLGVEIPIAEAMYSIIFERVPIERAVSQLLERAPRPE